MLKTNFIKKFQLKMTTFAPLELIGNIGFTVAMTYQIFIYTWNGNELYLQVITLLINKQTVKPQRSVKLRPHVF